MTTEIKENTGELKTVTGGFVAGFDPRRNLNGRPRKTFGELIMEEPEDRRVKVVRAQYARAEDGDTRAAEYLRDTTEGRPAQRVEVTDTTVADALRGEILAALANAGAIKYIDAEYTELPADA